MSKPDEVQVGGEHYRDFEIQPTEFITKNKLGFIEGNVVKYICRHKRKGGRQDLEKIKHYIDLLLLYDYPEEGKPPSPHKDYKYTDQYLYNFYGR